jgi:DNA-binding CsgD family transcriptional regulator
MSPPRKGLPLTDREMEALQALARGASYDQLARQWEITPKGAMSVGHRVIVKLGALNITHAVHLAWADGLIGTWPDCGTEAAYSRHKYHRQTADAKCRKSRAQRMSRKRGKIMARTLPPHPDWPQPPDDDDPVEKLAHVVDIYEDLSDSREVITATVNIYGKGVTTGLTMGDLRKLLRRFGR